ncbi:RNA polymerase sigma factor [compost metagenome]
MEQLGKKQRLVIYQRFFLDLSYQEIADANQVSIHTIYNTIYKSLEKIKNNLSSEQEIFLKVAVGLLSSFLLIFS